MIKQIKLGIKMLMYCHGIKTSVICALIMFAAGVLGIIADTKSWLGGYLIFVGAMWPVQMLYSLNTSDMIMSSGKSKSIQTFITTAVGAICYVICYIAVFILRLVQIKLNIAEVYMAGTQNVIIAIVVLLIMIYLAIALKYFVLSTVAFVMGGLVYFSYIDTFTKFLMKLELSYFVYSILGLLVILAGSVLCYYVTLFIYKKPVAKRSQLAGLRKAM